MSHNKIVIGNRAFSDREILDGNCYIGNSIAGNELSIDTLGATVDNSRRTGTLFVPKGSSGLLTRDDRLLMVAPYVRVMVDDMSLYRYGEAVYYYHDEVLVGKFYMASVKRVGKYSFEISCTSAVGLLDGATHYGGLYSGELAGAVLADIIGGAVEYTADPLFSAVPVYGWLPVGTRRENLHQLLFAVGGSLKKSAAGTLNVTFLDSKSPYDISDDRLGVGGSVDYQTPASGVAVTEHGYGSFATDEEATLFDGVVRAADIVTPKGVAASGVLVTFSEPMHDLSATNGTIIESGVNYAVLGESGYTTMTGKKFTHTTRVIARTVDDLPAGTKENIKRVEDATLVSLANSRNICDRLLNYFAARTITTEMIMGPERPGDPVVLNDPFDERTNGFLQSQDINISNTLLASADIICGYIPSGGGNNYTRCVVLTGKGEWTAPSDAKRIRVIPIGAGGAGLDGANGEIGAGVSGKTGRGNSTFTIGLGETGTASASASLPERASGNGGVGGAAGAPGKVREVDVDIIPGQSFSYECGVGGKSSGEDGTDSVFGDITSSSGSIYENGFVEIMSGTVYAARGADGTSGGKGGGSGEDGESKGNAAGGKKYAPYVNFRDNGSRDIGYVSLRGAASGQCGGAGGGGAGGSSGSASGTSGKDGDFGANGYFSFGSYSVGVTVYPFKGGVGGNGANGQGGKNYGSSGGGGGGGGGVGANGSLSVTNEASLTSWRTGEAMQFTLTAEATARPPVDASAGVGGKAGSGADGCIIIYY